MGHYNIHFSPTGGTKKVAAIICGALKGDFNEIDLCCNIEKTSLNEEDICLVSGPLVLEGSHGTYKEFGGSPLKPLGNESCTGCGLCARKCPVAAIDAQNPKATDPEKCISCMRCISICPKGARGVDPTLLVTISERISPHLGGRKDNHLFL